MMRAHQPGSQPIDIPETIPNPAVPRPVPVPSPPPKQPVTAPAPQNDASALMRRIVLHKWHLVIGWRAPTTSAARSSIEEPASYPVRTNQERGSDY
jgi:hypothetical protein